MFVNAFDNMDRRENFSLYGLRALFEYLEDLEDDIGEEMELDVIALCCEFSEEPLEDVLENYNLPDIEEMQDNSLVIELDNGNVLFQVF